MVAQRSSPMSSMQIKGPTPWDELTAGSCTKLAYMTVTNECVGEDLCFHQGACASYHHEVLMQVRCIMKA